MDRFRHGRVIFAGDSAHGVSPFGARGANSGVQDADNLAWKLAAVQRGQAPDALLDSYASRARIRRRREHPEQHARHRLHHAQERHQPAVPQRGAGPGARLPVRAALVNSGRLSVPATLDGSALNTPDVDASAARCAPARRPPTRP
jgi:3-(3-hydroxy-phenyl)propionate hydroxylase